MFEKKASKVTLQTHRTEFYIPLKVFLPFQKTHQQYASIQKRSTTAKIFDNRIRTEKTAMFAYVTEYQKINGISE